MVRNMFILLDASKDSENLLNYSASIFEKDEKIFNGVFLDGTLKEHFKNIFDDPSHITNQYSYSEIIQKILHSDTNNSEDFISRFVEKCEELNLKTRIYLNNDEIGNTLIDDSVYSDLMIIGKNIFNTKKKNKAYKKTIESLLYNSKCPILLIPNNLVPFKNVILLFDGSQKSFEAIKLYIYLFENQLQNNKIILFTIINEISIEKEKNIYDYIKIRQQYFSIMRAYPDTYYNELKLLTEQFNHSLLVTGANRDEIINDLVLNNKHPFFLNKNRAIFIL